MKKLAFALALCLSFGSLAFAQDAPQAPKKDCCKKEKTEKPACCKKGKDGKKAECNKKDNKDKKSTCTKK